MKAIIIGGLGRSGTSLIYKWIAANPNAVSFGNAESKFFSEPYGLADLYRGFVSDYTYARGLVAANEFRVLTTKHLVDSAFTGQDSIIKNLDDAGQTAYYEVVERFVSQLTVDGVPTYLSDVDFRLRVMAFLRELIQLFGGRDPSSVCFVEKTPHNALCYWIYQKLFDAASFIWLIRDPRAVVYSTLKQDWGPNTLEGAVEYVRQITRRYVDQRDLETQLEVKLEDLVYNSHETIERVQTYCSFGLYPGVEPADPDIVEDWRNYLFGDELKAVEDALAPEIAALGYGQ